MPVTASAVREIIGSGVRSLLHRIPQLFRDENSIRAGGDPGILTVTADVSFYSCVLNAACASGWTADWARSLGRGIDICGSGKIRIVVYDRNLPDVNWRDALRQFERAASQPRVLVASAEVDEELWCTVRRLRGYDVLPRASTSEQLSRELRFACLSLEESQAGL